MIIPSSIHSSGRSGTDLTIGRRTAYDTEKELQMAFDAFDSKKKGIVSTDMIGTMLGMLGHDIRSSALSEVVAEFDPHVFGKQSCLPGHGIPNTARRRSALSGIIVGRDREITRNRTLVFVPVASPDAAHEDSPTVQVRSKVVVVDSAEASPSVELPPEIIGYEVPRPTSPLPTPEEVFKTIPDVDTGCITFCASPDEDESEELEPIRITRTQTWPKIIVPPARAPLAETPRIARH
ncbi:hypothetical protein TSAR_012900 [Trichomalopsis sarcophagae]|uniref:EF-hand domain-containing protein n=1 Tax=Trichomalopsis sarcophagae TaxID=543379 RepID=A0A232FH81_9HYME|nr:hypothetical protein TSAR_012900 [Trichomalopsis sarcophagae]